ncbi:MAG: ABC transporter substrate-binding protein [Pseudomonadota bacterium]
MRLTLTFLAALLAAPALAQDCPSGQRPFTHAAGTDCIPTDPQRIVALQDQNVLLPLMELGVTLLGASGRLDADGNRVFRRLDGYDTSDVEFVGLHREEDKELVVALEPDLIITTPSPEWHYETYTPIAPTIVIDMFNQPLQPALRQFAEAVNRVETHDALKAEFDARAAAVRADLGDTPGQTKALVMLNNGALRALPWVQGFGAAFEAIGFKRTDWEEENVTGIGVVEFSREVLGNIEADAIFVIDFSGDDGPNGQYEQVVADPLFQLHPAGQAEQIYQIDGTRMGGTSWRRTLDGVNQLAEILGAPGFRTDIAD